MNTHLTLDVFDTDGESRDRFRHVMAEHCLNHHLLNTTTHYRELMVSLRDASHEVVGGIIGGTHDEWLFIESVWVTSAIRRQGHGSRMLRAAEREALSRGCGRVCIDTEAFGSEVFFLKGGYRICGEICDYLPGRHRYWLEKRLAAESVQV